MDCEQDVIDLCRKSGADSDAQAEDKRIEAIEDEDSLNRDIAYWNGRPEQGKTEEAQEIMVNNIVVLNVSSSSVHLCWEEIGYPQNASASEDTTSISTEYYEYQVRHHRTGFRTATWRYSDTLLNPEFVIQDLEEATKYTISVRCRKRCSAVGDDKSADADPDPDAKPVSKSWIPLRRSRSSSSDKRAKLQAQASWGKDSSPVEITTWTRDREQRLENLDRLRMYLQADLVDYEEEPHKPDTIIDKATRSMDGLLSVAGMLGVGGKWLRLAKQAWKVRQYGFAALIFREDLQEIVMTLSSQLGSMNEITGLSSKEIILGCYYYFWERKKERLIFPDMEGMEHKLGECGVVSEEVPIALLDELGLFFTFSRLAYHSTASEIQWILRHFSTSKVPTQTTAPENGAFQLICYRPNSGKMRPAFMLVANKSLKVAVLSIRGTKEFEDVLTNHSFSAAPAKLGSHSESKEEYYVHGGMLKAAEWLVNGQDAKSSSHTEVGAGLGVSLRKLHHQGFSIKLCGHSLGGGVAIISALLLADRYTDLHLTVYAYGTPPCVDEKLAESMKRAQTGDGHLASNSKLGSRIEVKNFIVRDDMVSRLSVQNIRNCALEIKNSKSSWSQYVQEDTVSYTARAKSLWAPPQRSKPLSQFGSSEGSKLDEGGIGAPSIETPQNMMELSTSGTLGLYIPGIIVHSYRFRGTDKAAIIDYRFHSLNRIQAFPNMQTDHHNATIAVTMKGIIAARNATLLPPVWQSMDEATREHALALGHSEDQMTKDLVSCSICKYFVGWNSRIGGTSGAVQVRSTYHCTACGKIVCANCSTHRRTIPEYGIIKPVRICDVCESKYALRFDLWQTFDKEVFQFR